MHCSSYRSLQPSRCESKYLVDVPILTTPEVDYSYVQVYMRILDITYEPPLFDASCGLLLRDELHHSFDRLEWSLYHKVSDDFSSTIRSTCSQNGPVLTIRRMARFTCTVSLSVSWRQRRYTARESLPTDSVDWKNRGRTEDWWNGITNSV